MSLRAITVALVAACLGLPASASAALHYRATLSFSGDYHAQTTDAGVSLSTVDAHASWRIADPDIVVTVQRGAFALFPSRHTTARITIAQHGSVLACDSAQQTFVDRLAVRPSLAWLTMRRTGSRAVLGFGWSGQRIDRHLSAAADEYCSERATIDRGGGNGDQAGAFAMARLFRVQLRFRVARLIAGRSIVLRVKVAKTRSDMFDGSGTTATLHGTYRLILSRSA